MSISLIQGGDAFAPHPLKQLQARVQSTGEGVQLQAASSIYFVHSDAALGDSDSADMAKLLRGEVVASFNASGICVLPRVGTVSPWSSQATDIARLCGHANIDRVERGRLLILQGDLEAAPQSRKILHDALTESLLPSTSDWESVFTAPQRRPLVTFTTAEGQQLDQVIADAEAKLGLALSDDERQWLATNFAEQKHVPSDAELMMFAQVNSEHCRHKIFNAEWTRDGEAFDSSLFGMIRESHKASPDGVLSAYSDNAAVLAAAGPTTRFLADADGHYQAVEAEAAIAIKVETHNHPTAIAPDPGAATGAGGEIRDEAATGRGGKPKAGLCGFTTSDLRIPELPQPWESSEPLPSRMAPALEIMTDGPLGAARYNNEFGRPNLAGYFRTLDRQMDGRRWGYAKPIMIAGGLGNLRPEHALKDSMQAGDLVVVLGGPGMLIGLGGGAASSVHAGASSEELDFASVQRANPELERRCQEVIDACWRRGEDNPIRTIHDVGAGGLSNAIPELLNDSELGGQIDLDAIPSADPALSPMELWCNESQERYVLAIAPKDREAFTALCARERCPFAVVGIATAERHLRVAGEAGVAVDLPMATLLGKLPRMHRFAGAPFDPNYPQAEPEIDLGDALTRVLQLPAVASKKFLITIGDRSVGGLTARDQMVGPWQVPVADCAVTFAGYEGVVGEAMAMGERAPVAMRNPAASARLSVAESLTNILAGGVQALADIRLSCNWMAAAGEEDQNTALLDAVEAVGREMCPELGIAIPVGKDSLSMQTRWDEAGSGTQSVTSPLSLVVSSFAPVSDVRAQRTPQLQPVEDSELWVVRLNAQRRLGGSALEQVYGADYGATPDVDDTGCLKTILEALISVRDDVLAWHDIGDGGAITSLMEMCFAGRVGLDIHLPLGNAPRELFSEEIGVVIQLRGPDSARIQTALREAGADLIRLATIRSDESVHFYDAGGAELFASSRAVLEQCWASTSRAMQARRDDPACADSEHRIIGEDQGLYAELKFTIPAAITSGERPRVAILREQGVNGQVEMAWMFYRAGFETVDVHMSDILSGAVRLDGFQGLAACGGFSYGDVLGAGRGWAATILHNDRALAEFSTFFARSDTFALGVCNGCQMLAQLRDIVPGAEHWPDFEPNIGGRFEARLSMVEVPESPSIMLREMAGSKLPVVLAHGEGRAAFRSTEQAAQAQSLVALRYVDRAGQAAERFPLNPNGSPAGITGLCSNDGRVTIMMPHPERLTRAESFSWFPPEWAGQESPWLQMFISARHWVG